MDEVNSDVMFSKCNCKAGQGGCCKHVATLLYTLLDFANLEISMIPDSLTCTQVAQKWYMPSTANMTWSKAVKFNDVSFTNAEPNRELEKAFKSSARDNYFAAPSLADNISSDSSKQLVGDLHNHGNAALFCKAVESNDYYPSMFFETSCKRKSFNNSAQDVTAENTNNEAIYKVFENISNENNSLINCFIPEELRGKTNMLVRVSKEQAIDIYINSKMQAKSPTWYKERIKRLAPSHFGRILNRRKNIEPTSIIKSITNSSNTRTENMPPSLMWGIEHENTDINKCIEMQQQCINIKDCGLVIDPKTPWLACSLYSC